MGEQEIIKAGTTIERANLAILQAQVGQTVQAEQRRSSVLEKLIAREALIQILETADDEGEITYSVDVRGGFAGVYRMRELLGLLDMKVNEHLLSVYPTRPEAMSIWLNRAQVEAQAAPDLWVAMGLHGQHDAVQADLLGWQTTSAIASLPIGADGMRELRIEKLRDPASLLALLSAPCAVRHTNLIPDPDTLRRLRLVLTNPNPEVQPLSQLSPDLFDCLASDLQLAEAYVEAVLHRPRARRRVKASAGWEARATQNTMQTTLALAMSGRVSEALELLRQAQDPELLQLRSMAHSLAGDLRAAIADARAAYRLAPQRALSFFAPAQRPQMALSWQYIPKAIMARSQTEIIDAEDPALELTDAEVQADLQPEDGGLLFSLGVQLPAQYAEWKYRVFIVDGDLRKGLGIDNRTSFRSAFSRSENRMADELEHILVSTSAVLTASGGLLEGEVGAGGVLDIWETLADADRQPDEFFSNKTVVVLLYHEPDPDGTE